MRPPIEPFATGVLPVSDGNTIYWETSGNPAGAPVLYLHGGPGGAMKTGYRRRADPERHLIVGFEQRGCGRSRPLATEDLDRLATNTTQALVADAEALREHLGVQRWLLHGVSWGTTLALAYAQAHPERVSALVLMATGLTSPAEVRWMTQDVGRLFPEQWQRFHDAGAPRPGQRLIDAYHEKITGADEQVRAAAVRAWLAWEDAHVSLVPGGHPVAQPADPGRQEVFATLVVHYWKHAAFLPEDALLAGLHRTTHLPATFVQGRYDVSGPPDVAWRLHRAWPGSRFVLVDDEGHGGAGMVRAVEEAIAAYTAAYTAA